MAGSIRGGKKAAQSNYARYGKDFYKRIGSIGGSHSRGGGFASDKVGADGLTGRERAKLAGAKGGRHSTRKGVGNGEGKRTRRINSLSIEEIEKALEEESGRH